MCFLCFLINSIFSVEFSDNNFPYPFLKKLMQKINCPIKFPRIRPTPFHPMYPRPILEAPFIGEVKVSYFAKESEVVHNNIGIKFLKK